MKNLVVLVILMMNSAFANASICGRFSAPVRSTLEQIAEIQFDSNKVFPASSHCFHYQPRGVRCDITYLGQRYYFFFSERFSKVDADNGTAEAYFVQWLKANNGRKAFVNTYKTVFEWENDYEAEECETSYEQFTYTLTIDGKESVILE